MEEQFLSDDKHCCGLRRLCTSWGRLAPEIHRRKELEMSPLCSNLLRFNNNVPLFVLFINLKAELTCNKYTHRRGKIGSVMKPNIQLTCSLDIDKLSGECTNG